MDLLSKLSRKKYTKSPLEKRLSKYTPDSAIKAYQCESQETSAQVAISTWVLHLSHGFAVGLREMFLSLHSSFRIDNEGFPYDAIAFEAATFCYFWLIEDFINEKMVENDNNPYYQCYISSMCSTISIFKDAADFTFDEPIFLNRCLTYAVNGYQSMTADEQFANFLISSFQSGTPQVYSPTTISSSLPLKLCIASYIPIFKTTHHDTLLKFANAVFKSSLEKVNKPIKMQKASPNKYRFLDHLLPTDIIVFGLLVLFLGAVFVVIKNENAQTNDLITNNPYIPLVQQLKPKPDLTKSPNGIPWPVKASYLTGYEVLNLGGLSAVTVDNSKNSSAVFVKLISLDGIKSKPVRQLFIPAFSHFKIDRVSPGKYDIRYRDLSDGDTFCSEGFYVTETISGAGTEYSNITLTLYKVSNGNTNNRRIAEVDF